jgi:hypothetical protein
LLSNEYVVCDAIYYATSTYAKHPHFWNLTHGDHFAYVNIQCLWIQIRKKSLLCPNRLWKTGQFLCFQKSIKVHFIFSNGMGTFIFR